jgi:hypothetical protein
MRGRKRCRLHGGLSPGTPRGHSHPDKLIGLHGSSESGGKIGDDAKARDFYEKIVAMTDGADQNRPELADARSFPNKH